MTHAHPVRNLRSWSLGPIVTLLVLMGTSACQGQAGSPHTPAKDGGTHAGKRSPAPRPRHPRKAPVDPAKPVHGSVLPSLYRVRTGVRAVALTYDDGPGPGPISTPGVLAILRAHHAKATFFVIGEEAERHPDLVREEHAQGMEVENHGYRHVNLASLDEAGQAAQIRKGAHAIQAAGARAPAFLRPPFGSQNARLREVASGLGERVVIWTIDPRDWANPGTGHISTFVLGHIEPGAIVLMHDGGGNRTETVEATRTIVPALERQGYRLVTLRELVALEGKNLTEPPGSGTNAAPGGPGAASTRHGSGAGR